MKHKLLIIVCPVAIMAFMISCFCKETKVPYVLMENIGVVNCSDENPIAENREVNSENFRINLRISGRLTAMNNVSIPFVNRAYATSCDPGNGVRGLKHKIVNFGISCDHAILGVAPGGNVALPEFMKVYYQRNALKIEMSVAEWIKNMNDNEGFANYSKWDTPFRKPTQSYFFFFTEKFATDDFISFKMRIELSNGQILDAETTNVKLY